MEKSTLFVKKGLIINILQIKKHCKVRYHSHDTGK